MEDYDEKKVKNMPNIKTRIKKASKNGKDFLIVETVITKFFSADYLDKVWSSQEEKKQLTFGK